MSSSSQADESLDLGPTREKGTAGERSRGIRGFHVSGDLQIVLHFWEAEVKVGGKKRLSSQ